MQGNCLFWDVIVQMIGDELLGYMAEKSEMKNGRDRAKFGGKMQREREATF